MRIFAVVEKNPSSNPVALPFKITMKVAMFKMLLFVKTLFIQQYTSSCISLLCL